MAQTVDAQTFALTGEPRTILARVQYFPQTDLAVFDARGGTLVAQTGAGAAKSQFTWFDRSGKQLLTVLVPDLFSNVKLSPDGKRIIFTSNRREHFSLFERNSDGSGSDREIADSGDYLQNPWDWSNDGKYVLVRKQYALRYLQLGRRPDASSS